MSNHNKETEARCFHCYRHYVEGTAAWALYMMRMGHKVTNPKDDPRVYYLPEGGMIQVDGMEVIAGNQWIDYWCIDIPDGWEIYEEPKPLLADAAGIYHPTHIKTTQSRNTGETMKFETINNQLCRMVEPEPLTETATFPCVVRLIQDDSPMGRYNLKLRNALEPLVVTGIAKDIGVVTHLVPRPHFSCECYEIIGYPVADGSAEWALCHVLHKERRALTGYVNDVLVHIQNTEYGIGLYYSGKIMPFDFITPEQFIEGAAHTGWQLYEEPEYKVGDYIKDGGDYYIVTSPTTCVGLLNGKGYEICPKTCKIVSPSEVVLDFGSGIKGTVGSCEHDGGCVRVISGDRVIAHIMTDVLEQPTRNLVGQLLKAQEEKC